MLHNYISIDTAGCQVQIQPVLTDFDLDYLNLLATDFLFQILAHLYLNCE